MRRRRLSWPLVSVLAAAAWVAAGCGGDDEANGPAPDVTHGAEQATASITGPEDGAALDAGDIEVALDVGNFEVVDKLGEAAVAGEGHVHFYVDVDPLPTAPGQAAVTAPEKYHAAAETSYTWQGVRPGQHTFGVQLVNNDHTPLEPSVTDEVTVTIQ